MAIPIINIFKESLRHVITHKLSWVKVGFSPLILFLIGKSFTFISILFLGKSSIGLLQWSSWHLGIFMINGVLSLIWGASFYMNGYRYGILNEEKERWWYLPLNEYLFKLITCSLLIVIPIGGILSLLPIATFLDLVHIRITLPLEFILICLGVYVSARLSMVFPLVALDHKNPFRTSWQMMKGNVFRLLKMVFLMCFSIFLSILLAIFIIEIFTFILKLITPIFGGYFQVINIAIFGKIISSLMSLLFVGVGLKGVLGFFVDFISGAGLSIINSKLFYSFIIIDFIFLPPILLFTWALFTKAFSLFYLSLREGKI